MATLKKSSQIFYMSIKNILPYELGQHEMTPDTLGKLATLYDTSVDPPASLADQDRQYADDRTRHP